MKVPDGSGHFLRADVVHGVSGCLGTGERGSGNQLKHKSLPKLSAVIPPCLRSCGKNLVLITNIVSTNTISEMS